jgi:hypothetical protein
MDRTIVLAVVGLLAGGAGLTLSVKYLGRAVRFRFQRGRPYIPGSLRRAALSTLVFLLIFLFGGGLAGVRWLLRDFQPVVGPTRAARVRVRDQGAGGLLLELEPDKRHPDLQAIAAGLPAQTWEVRGVVVSFPVWLRSLGIDAFQRLTDAGAPAGGGRSLPARARRAADLVAGLPETWGVRVRSRVVAGRGPLPEWTAVLADRNGYFLGPEEPYLPFSEREAP